jgi:SulP family sulfate permease
VRAGWTEAMTQQVLRRLRSARPDRATLGREAIAGVPGAIGSVPDGMASAVLAGVNPIHGLYASFAGPVAGGSVASTRLMVITTTTAASLTAGSAVAGVRPDQRASALALLTLLAGAAMVGAALARLGRYTRFVSLSVMTGFLTGVAVNIVFGQLPTLTGAHATGSFALAKAADVLTHPGRIDLPSLLVGLAALALFWGIGRTRYAPFASIVALVVGSLLALPLASVATVQDEGSIPTGLPLPAIPRLGLLSFDLVTGALAVAAVVLVQGAGVAESAPNRDGSFAGPNRDFAAQGAGNLASALFTGQPVGGSVGQTALNVAAGARTRWASIFSGLWMLVILVAFSGVVGRVAMPTLAAILILAAVSSVRIERIAMIWRTSSISKVAFATTLLSTLFLSVPAAVGIGVAISLLLQLNQEALDLRLVELAPDAEGRLVERAAPTRLESNSITALDVYGSLFYAGARTLQVRLPDPGSADSAVVILRLRGRGMLGTTSLSVLGDYAERLAARGGRLYITGVDSDLADQIRASGRFELDGPTRIYGAKPAVGTSTMRALQDARAWLLTKKEGDSVGSGVADDQDDHADRCSAAGKHENDERVERGTERQHGSKDQLA